MSDNLKKYNKFEVLDLLYNNKKDFSRNKNFEAYQDDEFQKAYRHFLMLNSIKKIIISNKKNLNQANFFIKKLENNYILNIGIPAISGQRISKLNKIELKLLLNDPQLKSILSNYIETIPE